MFSVGSELAVPVGPLLHKGVYIGNGLVFHNSGIRGEELVPLEEFANGKVVQVTAQYVDDTTAFMIRLYERVASPLKYNFAVNNCEHTSSELRTGTKRSPQLQFWSATLLSIGLLLYTLRKK